MSGKEYWYFSLRPNTWLISGASVWWGSHWHFRQKRIPRMLQDESCQPEAQIAQQKEHFTFLKILLMVSAHDPTCLRAGLTHELHPCALTDQNPTDWMHKPFFPLILRVWQPLSVWWTLQLHRLRRMVFLPIWKLRSWDWICAANIKTFLFPQGIFSSSSLTKARFLARYYPEVSLKSAENLYLTPSITEHFNSVPTRSSQTPLRVQFCNTWHSTRGAGVSYWKLLSSGFIDDRQPLKQVNKISDTDLIHSSSH